MATGGSCSSLTSDKRESLTCALCLDIFNDPKLLTCAHTFCKKCLEDLIHRHPQGSFPCPACRKDVHIPAEGASGFQANFYIDQEELERARDDTTCSVHAQKNLDMFCVECDLLICMDCKQSVHFHHKTQSLQDAKRDAEEQLSKDKVRLREMKDRIEKKIPERSKDLEEFMTKKAAVESKIRDRHASLLAEADRFLKEGLGSLEDTCSETENKMSEDLQTAKDNVGKLESLERKIDLIFQIGDSCKMVNTATEVRTGCGSEDNVRKMEVKPLQHVSRPVHLADIPEDDAIFVSMKDFIGRAQQITYHYADPEVRVKEEIRCGDHADSVVFCVCPGDEKAYVSFESQYMDKEPHVKKILNSNNGISNTEEKGPVSYIHRKADEFLLISHVSEEYQYTFVKYNDLDSHHRLDTRSKSATGTVTIGKVISEEPFKTHMTDLFDITCGPQRACDMNSSQKLFAVVEDCGPHRACDMNSSQKLFAVVEDCAAARPGDTSRQVKLFRDRKRAATDTYHSPLTPCRPADVCFFTLGVEEVLLIADELNDAIHVVEVKDDRLTFSRFLTPGCPLLVQPTALNTDRQGRLWVGCRGGILLTMEPVPTADAAAAAAAVDVGDDKTE